MSDPRTPRLGFLILITILLALSACDDTRPSDERAQGVTYRAGTAQDNYSNSGERGNMVITEILWAGSVRISPDGQRIHDPSDIFIELQNKHARPVHLTRWQLVINSGTGHPRAAVEFDNDFTTPPTRTYLIPARENGQPVAPNEFIVIAAKRDGAFPNADFYIEDLDIPLDNFEILILDTDDRLIEQTGSTRWRIYAGAWDSVTTRSMERIQQIFANIGSRETSWHTYSLSDQSPNEPQRQLHADLTQNIAPDFRQFTLASPGRANSPDYSGNTSFGDFN